MNTVQKVHTALLAAIVVLLAANLTRGPSAAQAELPEVGPVPPQVVSIAAPTNNQLLRQYDDGSVEIISFTNFSCADPSSILCATSLIDFCQGDNNYDRVVDVQDLLTMLALWGPCPIPGS